MHQVESNSLSNGQLESVKHSWRLTLKFWLYCFLKVPMIYALRPYIMVWDAPDPFVHIEAGRSRISKNQFGTKYLGALVALGEMAIGAPLHYIGEKQEFFPLMLVYDMRAKFFANTSNRCVFVADQDELIDFLNLARASQKSEKGTVKSYIYDKETGQLLAEISYSFSLKIKRLPPRISE